MSQGLEQNGSPDEAARRAGAQPVRPVRRGLQVQVSQGPGGAHKPRRVRAPRRCGAAPARTPSPAARGRRGEPAAPEALGLGRAHLRTPAAFRERLSPPARGPASAAPAGTCAAGPGGTVPRRACPAPSPPRPGSPRALAAPGRPETPRWGPRGRRAAVNGRARRNRGRAPRFLQPRPAARGSSPCRPRPRPLPPRLPGREAAAAGRRVRDCACALWHHPGRAAWAGPGGRGVASRGGGGRLEGVTGAVPGRGAVRPTASRLLGWDRGSARSGGGVSEEGPGVVRRPDHHRGGGAWAVTAPRGRGLGGVRVRPAAAPRGRALGGLGGRRRAGGGAAWCVLRRRGGGPGRGGAASGGGVLGAGLGRRRRRRGPAGAGGARGRDKAAANEWERVGRRRPSVRGRPGATPAPARAQVGARGRGRADRRAGGRPPQLGRRRASERPGAGRGSGRRGSGRGLGPAGARGEAGPGRGRRLYCLGRAGPGARGLRGPPPARMRGGPSRPELAGAGAPRARRRPGVPGSAAPAPLTAGARWRLRPGALGRRRATAERCRRGHRADAERSGELPAAELGAEPALSGPGLASSPEPDSRVRRSPLRSRWSRDRR
ncbi:collagen alpha-2(I) chain-like [Loxodonta africana]|uniref:collagen alpha-2(I) chain-like n=1 Tax=Loxodonta africana TaxID=9785 RepID=UPI0030D17B41